MGESMLRLEPSTLRDLVADDVRYVGNTMVTFVMQSMGCEVAAMNTVQFSELQQRTLPSASLLTFRSRAV